MKRLSPMLERVMERVQITPVCWPWTGTKSTKGYGVIGRAKGEGGPGHYVSAHRLVYEMSYGPIPEGSVVMHVCDEPLCVRPSHLYLGSLADNAVDKMRKGRAPRGERHSQAKLTAVDVLTIRQRYATGGMSQMQLARQYGVEKSTIRNVVTGHTWAHVR